MTKFYLKIFLCIFIIYGDYTENKDEEIEVQRELNLTFYDEIFQEENSEIHLCLNVSQLPEKIMR